MSTALHAIGIAALIVFAVVVIAVLLCRWR